MPNLLVDSFLGYMPDIANAPANSALTMKNVLLHKHRDAKTNLVSGWIEQAEGYAKKIYVPGTATPGTLPANDTTIRKISLLTPENIFNLWIPANGSVTGQNVTVVAATYRKTGFFTANPTVDRFGIWIRPYWNGSAWIDAWYELTEMFIFTLIDLGSAVGQRLYIDDGSTFAFKTLDPTGIVFAADYFKNWTIVYSAHSDSENYDLVAGSGYGSEFHADSYYLDLIHNNNDFTSRTVGTKLLLYRSFMPAELPSALTSQIRGLLSEIRLTSGNSATDVSLMAGYRNISFPLSFPINPTLDYTRTINALIADTAMPYLWPYAVSLGISLKAAATDPLSPASEAAGGVDVTYYLRCSLVFDDGNESKTYNAFTEAGSPGSEWTTMNAGNYLTIVAGSGNGIKINGLRSWGALPPRARYLRVYMSSDSVNFYRVLDIDLRDAASWASPQSPRQPITVNSVLHLWSVTPDIDITKTLWDNAGAEATAQLGRASTDDGVAQYKAAATVGRTTYYIGVRKNGILYPNLALASTANGDGQPMFDCVGLVTNLLIDMEYNDDDELVGVEALQDRTWFGKRSTTIVVTKSATGAFTRQIITQEDGLCSIKSLAKFQDVLYWAGYNGIYEYSTRGNIKINEPFEQEWIAVSQANKEAAVGTIDRTNLEYHLAYSTFERIYNIRTRQWRCETRATAATRFAANLRTGTVDFLAGSYIETITPSVRQDGNNFDMEFQTNDFEVSPTPGEMANLIAVEVRYNSSIPISVQIYADGVAAGSAQTLAASTTDLDVILTAPLSTVCKKFRFKFTASTTADAQVLQIKHLKPVFEIIPSGISAVV